MGYKWGISNGRGRVKEMKIRLDPVLHRRLARMARESRRSMSKQIAVYIDQGIKIDREEKRKASA